MFICEFCGKTVNKLNKADACQACAASMTFKAVKQEVKKDVEDKNNQEFMLAYFGITLEQFEAVTHENLSEIVDSEFAGYYKNDAKRVLWHEYRANAFTKKGDLRKAAEKKINAFIESQPVVEVANEEVLTKGVATTKTDREVKAAPKKVVRNEREQYALDKAAEHRATAKLLGAKSLTGSAKQKAWAEKIRKEFIEKTESENVLYEVLNNPRAQHSDFWIALRDCEYMDIVKVLAGVLNYDRFKTQALAVRGARELLSRYGRNNKMVGFRLTELKERYGVEL